MDKLLDVMSSHKRVSPIEKTRGGYFGSNEVTIVEVQGQATTEPCRCPNYESLVEYFEAENKRLEYEGESESVYSDEDEDVEPSSLRLFFIAAKRGEDSPHVQVDPDIMGLLHEKAGLTSKLLLGYYATPDWAVVPAGPVPNDLDNMAPTVKYGFWIWETRSTHSLTQTIADSRSTTYLCINFPQHLQENITNTLKKFGSLASNPLFLDTLIVDELLVSYREAILGYRAQLLATETQGEESSVDDQTKSLHRLAMSLHTISKDLTDIEQHIQQLRFLALSKGQSQADDSGCDEEVVGPATPEVLRLQKSMCDFWSRLVTTYLERIELRINLIQRRAAQKDNHLGQDISYLATDLALQAQRDGKSILTLAMVTVLCLPGTLVCSLLSTIFFCFDGAVLAVSFWWWILPSAVVPLSSMAMYLFLLWFRERLARDTAVLRKQRAELDSIASSINLVGYSSDEDER